MTDVLRVAEALARQAGAVLLDYFGQRPGELSIQNKGSIDLVTEADTAAEHILLQGIRQAFPHHAIVAEESGESGHVDAEFRWLVDPLDGTVNFAHGLPHFSVLLAVQQRQTSGFETIAALTYEPLRDELFAAAKGLGATLNGQPIAVSSTGRLIDAIGATGFSYGRLTAKQDNHPEFCRMNLVSQGVRRFGSAGLDLAYLACGRYDFYWETTLNPWDVCGGVLLVQEAGGRVSATDGASKASAASILATNGPLHAATAAALASAAVHPANSREGLKQHLPKSVGKDL